MQFCPSCGSIEIDESGLLTIGDPFMRDALVGWECLDCGYIGKDFFIVSKDEHMQILDEKYRNDLVYALV